MLIEQRNGWRKNFQEGGKPLTNKALDKYREKRNSEEFRLSPWSEEVFEYVLFLEEQLQTKLKVGALSHKEVIHYGLLGDVKLVTPEDWKEYERKLNITLQGMSVEEFMRVQRRGIHG